MLVLGLTGGVGSGKSRILEILEQNFKAAVIQTDQVAAELEQPGQPGFVQLVACFGSEILNESGELDRRKFAERIFSDEIALEKVNAIMHPLTWQKVKMLVASCGLDLAVIESALFDETSREVCQKLIYVDTTDENRITRLMASREYTREKCFDIMKHQPDRESFLKLADFVIHNDGTIEETERQLQSILRKIETEDKQK